MSSHATIFLLSARVSTTGYHQQLSGALISSVQKRLGTIVAIFSNIFDTTVGVILLYMCPLY